MIAQLFNFGIVFLAFYLLAAKPLRKLMKERGEEIETGLQNAKAGMEMIQKAKEEYEENTIKLRKQSIDTQKELKKELEKLRDENIERIKKDNSAFFTKIKQQLSGEEFLQKFGVKKTDLARGDVLTEWGQDDILYYYAFTPPELKRLLEQTKFKPLKNYYSFDGQRSTKFKGRNIITIAQKKKSGI